MIIEEKQKTSSPVDRLYTARLRHFSIYSSPDAGALSFIASCQGRQLRLVSCGAGWRHGYLAEVPQDQENEVHAGYIADW